MQETIEKKELDILDQELTLLRGQVAPDFISDSLKSIRALAKTDKRASAPAMPFSAQKAKFLCGFRKPWQIASLCCTQAPAKGTPF